MFMPLSSHISAEVLFVVGFLHFLFLTFAGFSALRENVPGLFQ